MPTQSQEFVLTLGEALTTVDALPWDHLLYLEKDQPWKAQTGCVVADPNDTESDDPDEEPDSVKYLELKCSLGVSEAQEIVANAREQVPSATVAELVQAFNYYWAHDAFIEFP